MKIDIFHITESEMEIMECIWQASGYVTLSEMSSAIPNQKWKNSTLHTFAGRLVKKGLLTCVQISGQNFYLPVFSKEDYRFVIAKTLLQKLFSGSFAELVTVLLRDMDLTGEELTAVKDLTTSAVLPAEEWGEMQVGRGELAVESEVDEEKASGICLFGFFFFWACNGRNHIVKRRQMGYLSCLRDIRAEYRGMGFMDVG